MSMPFESLVFHVKYFVPDNDINVLVNYLWEFKVTTKLIKLAHCVMYTKRIILKNIHQ